MHFLDSKYHRHALAAMVAPGPAGGAPALFPDHLAKFSGPFAAGRVENGRKEGRRTVWKGKDEE